MALADGSISLTNIFSGPIEERFTLLPLNDYALVQRSSVGFPVVPLFEMYGLPRPFSHIQVKPSLVDVQEELSKDGSFPISRSGEMLSRRNAYREQVVSRLGQMPC